MPPRKGFFQRIAENLQKAYQAAIEPIVEDIADGAKEIIQDIGDSLRREPSQPPRRRQPPQRKPPPRQPPREPPRAPPPEPPREPPRAPPGTGGGVIDRTAPFREMWNDYASDRVILEIHDRTGNSETEIFYDLFRPFYALATEESRAKQLEMWRDYIEAFVNDSETFTKMEFFAEWDIAPSSFSWEAWREARGYGKK